MMHAHFSDRSFAHLYLIGPAQPSPSNPHASFKIGNGINTLKIANYCILSITIDGRRGRRRLYQQHQKVARKHSHPNVLISPKGQSNHSKIHCGQAAISMWQGFKGVDAPLMQIRISSGIH